MPTPKKCYKNIDFLSSLDARPIRILCEYEEPAQRFRRYGVEDTIVLFGSARTLPGDVAKERHAAALESGDAAEIAAAERSLRSSVFYDQARELSRRITEWSMNDVEHRNYYICTGGGPGIMEAGNRGASDVPGGLSVGLGISLPFEEKVNRYVPEELAFEFHYFFTRKYWFMYFAKALIVFPGGFGTLDEFAELLTLIQTQKIKKAMPIILFGSEYWNTVINIPAMVEWGTISESDLELFRVIDTVDEAFDYLTGNLQ